MIPGYESLEVLGRGGMGVVYRARQQGLGRTVALKTLTDSARGDPEMMQRFQAEAEAVARLQHPHIVQIHEVGQAQGQPFFALEYLPGGSLADKIKGTPQPPRAAAELVRTLAQAVHFAHQRGILHRDLKPANVLLAEDGTPKVADFGLAKQLESGPGLTRTGDVLGTPRYMAPEQAAGKGKELGPAADIYALGTILYELLTGRPPFVADNAMETLLQVLQEEPLPPRRLLPRLPRDLETICLKCLQKRPGARYPSAEALADDLGRFLRGEPIRARPVGRLERMHKWARRRPAQAVLLVGSVLALLAGAAGLAWHHVQMHRTNAYLTRALAARDHEQARNVALMRTSLTVLGDFGNTVDDQLASVPHLDRTRKKLLEQRLRFYEPFLKLNPNDPGMRLRQGEARFAVAVINQRLGKLPEAESLLRQAVAQFEAVRSEEPSAVADHDLGAALVQLGTLLDKLDRHREAEKNLRGGLALLEQAVPTEPAEASAPDVIAVAHTNLAHLLHKLRRPDEAGKEHEKALAIRTRLVAQHPDQDQYRRALAVTWNNLGALHLHAGHPRRAEKAFAETRKLLEELAPRLGHDVEHRRMTAGVCHNLGMLAQKTSPRKALGLYAQALRLWQELRNDFPAVPEYQLEVARVEFVRGLLLGQVQGALPAVEALRRATALYEGLSKEQPGVVAHKEDLSKCLFHLGRLLVSARKWLEGEACWRRDETLLRDLLAQHPDKSAYQGDLGHLLANLAERDEARSTYLRVLPPPNLGMVGHDLGMALSGLTNLVLWQGYLDKAIAERREGLRHTRRARQTEPTNRLVATSLGWQSAALAVAAARRGNHAALADGARGMAESAEAPVLVRQDAGLHYRLAAGHLAYCATLARDDRSQSPADRVLLAHRYAEEALTLLGKALARGYRNAAELRRDAGMKSLRDRPEFQTLLREMEAKR